MALLKFMVPDLEQLIAMDQQLEIFSRAWCVLEIEGAELRRRMNNELNFPPNFQRLVLGCIDADF